MRSGERPLKVLIFGHEIGGQMQLLAEGLRARGIEATAAAVNEDFRRFRCDVHVYPRGGRLRKEIARWAFGEFAMANYDVFHFFWGVSLWSFWRWHLLDLPVLRALGRRIVVHFRGLDLVDIGTFDRARESVVRPESGGTPLVQLTSRADQRRKLARWRRWAHALLISEPDLWDLVPEATLSPQVLDISQWPKSEKKSRNNEVTIVHAPTNRRKKGTEFVVQACEELQRRGLPVRLVLVEGMPYREVLELYRQADIAVDQVLYGWHGKFSVETMNMGIPTVCYIREDLLKHRPDLPIVSATPGNLADTLEALIRDGERREALAVAGPRYVQRYHSLDVVLDDLISIYDPGNAVRSRGAVGRA